MWVQSRTSHKYVACAHFHIVRLTVPYMVTVRELKKLKEIIIQIKILYIIKVPKIYGSIQFCNFVSFLYSYFFFSLVFGIEIKE